LTNYTEGLHWDVGEVISQKKMNQIVNNVDFLYGQKIKVRYRAHELTRTTGVRIAAGKHPIGPAPKSGVMNRDIYFGNFFTTGCRPVVNATLAQVSRGRSFITITGVGGNGMHPSHSGFRAVVAHQTVPGKTFNYPRALWIHWQAFGY